MSLHCKYLLPATMIALTKLQWRTAEKPRKVQYVPHSTELRLADFPLLFPCGLHPFDGNRYSHVLVQPALISNSLLNREIKLNSREHSQHAGGAERRQIRSEFQLK